MDFFEGNKKHSNETFIRNSAPIMAWEFRYEFMNELKAAQEDLKRLKVFSSKFKWNSEELNIKDRIGEETVVITDLEQKIVFASSGILSMTGYSENEILGKTPKMFQGPSTSEIALKEIREAIKSRVPFDKTVLNYKKNGRTYKCKIEGYPVFNVKGKITHYIAFEKAA